MYFEYFARNLEGSFYHRSVFLKNVILFLKNQIIGFFGRSVKFLLNSIGSCTIFFTEIMILDFLSLKIQFFVLLGDLIV